MDNISLALLVSVSSIRLFISKNPVSDTFNVVCFSFWALFLTFVSSVENKELRENVLLGFMSSFLSITLDCFWSFYSKFIFLSFLIVHLLFENKKHILFIVHVLALFVIWICDTNHVVFFYSFHVFYYIIENIFFAKFCFCLF